MFDLRYFLILFTLFMSEVVADTKSAFFGIQNLQFHNSLQKKHGNRYIGGFSYKHKSNFYAFRYVKSDIKTYQPPMKDDLDVDKYYFHYNKYLTPHQVVGISYATISDNLTKETDGGKIYGISYRYKLLKLSQYLSDYKHFNVYQSEVAYGYKYKYRYILFSTKILGKYLYLQDRKSNNYTKKANANYFTSSFMLKGAYQGYYAGVGIYFGERLFAVMQDGFGVQNRAMEFDRTAMATVGHTIGDIDIVLKYLYMRATEVPMENSGVSVRSVILNLKYNF